MDEPVFEISAREVTLEITDERTGKHYRRTLPIDYYETANAVILRGENRQSPTVAGLYPTGEGAGYAGGIMSAAIDGIVTAEAVLGETYGRKTDQ